MATTEVGASEWLAAVGEARLRVRFDAHPKVKAARKAYRQAMVVARRMPKPAQGVFEKEAWIDSGCSL